MLLISDSGHQGSRETRLHTGVARSVFVKPFVSQVVIDYCSHRIWLHSPA